MTHERPKQSVDADHEGRQAYEMDIDRMVNEGLGGGQVTKDNGLIDDTTVTTMDGEQRMKDELERENLD
ncbi:hypothetical protein PA598K_04463 [Paenibacillus sp. 598K]|uniref:hypothetical protein n=1 Tax=Paenibacillus sp. 598K TaxID=1117987 RepID=UPI000FFAD54D|nr:hypothetical protein [Paenibacillus sp. 598K]GBF76024.1 hypothetical protein PA598K_04463 [Paenibacillus sp. 598K]